MVGLKLGIDCGVSILPMVVYHAAQLILDAIWVEWLQRGDSTKQ
jgi:predicted Na+-dependent transporter